MALLTESESFGFYASYKHAAPAGQVIAAQFPWLLHVIQILPTMNDKRVRAVSTVSDSSL